MKKKFTKILGVGLTLALLTSLLLTAAPVSALTQPDATLDDYEISATATYSIVFTLGVEVPAAGKFVIAFPTGTDLTNVATDDTDVDILATSGIGTVPVTGSVVTTVKSPSATTGPTLTIAITGLTGPSSIGVGAIVQLTIRDVQNPDTIGSYTLDVSTTDSSDVILEAAVTSSTYTTIAPIILPLPGVVERYNSAGVLMEQTNSIVTAVDNAVDGDTILVGAGTYDEVADIVIDQSITITGDAATTIIKDTNDNNTGGTVTISFNQTALLAGVVFDGFTVMGNLTPASAMTITGIGVTVQNCIFTRAGIATSTVAQDMIEVYSSATAATTYGNTITNSTFDTTLAATNDDGIVVYTGKLTISDNTFITDGVVSKDDLDRAVVLEQWKNSGERLLAVTVTDNTFSGTGRKGVGADAGAEGTATISGNTFDGLNQAIESDAALLTLTIKDNVIKNSGGSTAETVTSGTIDLGDSAQATITNNTFIDNLGYVLEVGPGGAAAVKMLFNDMSGNAYMVLNNHSSETVDASHNYWDVAPTADDILTFITYLPVLSVSPSAGALAVGLATLITETTVGVDVIATGTVVPAIIGVANYAANPQADTPLPAIAGGFYDVYLADATAGNTTSVLIKFYNANITANTDVYVWGTIAGGWQACTTQGVNTYGGYAYVTVTDTIPDIAGLAGTPFALVAATPTALTAPEISSPVLGDDTVRLRPVFAWLAVAGADGYYFQLADNAEFVVPMVKMEGDVGRLSGTTYAYVGEELPYSTPYHWRVKAVSGTIGAGNLAESPWTGGVFITMDEPVEPVPPIVIEPTPPAPAPIIEPIVEVITPPATEITPAWIYVIIGVGAVLVIALLVLIVRTRRVA